VDEFVWRRIVWGIGGGDELAVGGKQRGSAGFE